MHTCSTCGYSTSRLGNYTRHLKLKHENQGNDISNEELVPLEQTKIQHTFTVNGCHSEDDSYDESENESFTTADSGTEGDCEDGGLSDEDPSESRDSDSFAGTERADDDNETVRNYRFTDSNEDEDVGSPEKAVQSEFKPRKNVYKKTMKWKLPED